MFGSGPGIPSRLKSCKRSHRCLKIKKGKIEINVRDKYEREFPLYYNTLCSLVTCVNRGLGFGLADVNINPCLIPMECCTPF